MLNKKTKVLPCIKNNWLGVSNVCWNLEPLLLVQWPPSWKHSSGWRLLRMCMKKNPYLLKLNPGLVLLARKMVPLPYSEEKLKQRSTAAFVEVLLLAHQPPWWKHVSDWGILRRGMRKPTCLLEFNPEPVLPSFAVWPQCIAKGDLGWEVMIPDWGICFGTLGSKGFLLPSLWDIIAILESLFSMAFNGPLAPLLLDPVGGTPLHAQTGPTILYSQKFQILKSPQGTSFHRYSEGWLCCSGEYFLHCTFYGFQLFLILLCKVFMQWL